jgi:hypothetical protein
MCPSSLHLKQISFFLDFVGFLGQSAAIWPFSPQAKQFA